MTQIEREEGVGLMKTGIELIADERTRQKEGEGWSAQHDNQHILGELALAGAIYAWPGPRPVEVKKSWPWDRAWWKPLPIGGTDGRIRELTKAGALIAAEIDRLLAASGKAA